MSVLILDFGSQFTQLIARRVREEGVFSEIKPGTVKFDEKESSRFDAIILSGGPSSVTDADAPVFDTAWLHTKKPTLGVCYGMLLIVHEFGGTIGQGTSREYGPSELTIQKPSGVFEGFGKTKSTVWMSHGDHIESLPRGFELTASSPGAPIAAIESKEMKMCAVQFHPEVVHTERGKEIIKNFINFAGCERNWSPGNFIEETVERIKSEVSPDAHVLCALSGGVDSTVAAVLVSKALGKRLTCIFVDNGLLRKDEGDQVSIAMEKLDLQFIRVNAEDEFVSALKGITDPETKRKTIGRLFIEIFDREAKKIKNVTHLVQGTLYPDVIESVSVRGPSATIKTHHNVGGLPEKMNLKLIEPLRELFKDEVRKIGLQMGVPESVISRQPFPGPGLAIRVLGEVSKEKLDLLKAADKIFLEEVREAGLYKSLWQSFAVLLPVQSVGVMGDGRTYEWTLALRAVTSDDGMTANWAYLPENLLRKVSNRIINETKGINRVVMDISSKPPATIEWE